MLAQFFQVRTSGVGFFEELNKALANPAPRYNLLELMHACLLLGFEGQYRGAAGGDGELQRIRRDVYQTLRHVKARTDDEISPRWRGMTLRMRDLSTRIPLWAIASGAGLGLVGVFFLLRFLIGNDADALADTAGRAPSLGRASTSRGLSSRSTSRRSIAAHDATAAHPRSPRRRDHGGRHGRRAGR